ncbi:FUSC family protein [Streptomyces noursei]|uniref:FUSC family protein n=1 Tax=Streptomyces noursei TaxID=1971 RepID=UPI003804B276
MGKHAKHARPTGRWKTETTPDGTGAVRFRPLPVRSTVRLRRPVDIWHKPALSAVVALAVPDLVLLGLGRLDLVLYTSAGAMCALYAHGLPYAARARTLPWVVLGMVASLAVALTAASLVTSAAVLVVLASLVAAAHKVVCDATRIGPPGNLILTFIAASAFFVPQRPADVLPHAALALGTGAFAWLVCMAPALVRPQGPERIATARALQAAAGLLRARAEAAGAPSAGEAEPPGVVHARHATAAAVNAAWHALFLVPTRTPATAAAREGLERLLVRAESSLGGEPRDAAAEAGRLGEWARELRSGRPLPEVTLTGAEAEELAGVAWEARAAWEAGVVLEPGMALRSGVASRSGAMGRARAARRGEGARASKAAPARGTAGFGTSPEVGAAAGSRAGRAVAGGGLRSPAPGRPRGLRAVLGRLRPGSPLLPIGARVAVGCVLAGWASLAVGVGHPYWAVVTAASIYQANTTLSWQRAFQRTLGNLLGLVLFTALLPLIHTGQVTMIALALAFQLGAEATITRNYWLGSVCVTPMALLLTEFGRPLPAGTLIADRWLDTVVGAAVGLVCCVLVTNRRAADRIDLALERVAEAEAAAARLLAAGPGANAARAGTGAVPAGPGAPTTGAGAPRTGTGRAPVGADGRPTTASEAHEAVGTPKSEGTHETNRVHETNGRHETNGGHETSGRPATAGTPETTGAYETTETRGINGTHGADWAPEAGWARDRLAGCLVELREAVDVANGEWWQRALPEERIAGAEQQGHRTLAVLVRRLTTPALAA